MICSNNLIRMIIYILKEAEFIRVPNTDPWTILSSSLSFISCHLISCPSLFLFCWVFGGFCAVTSPQANQLAKPAQQMMCMKPVHTLKRRRETKIHTLKRRRETRVRADWCRRLSYPLLWLLIRTFSTEIVSVLMFVL